MIKKRHKKTKEKQGPTRIGTAIKSDETINKSA
jgi:hypothetical protein